jgi:hypothetical protein
MYLRKILAQERVPVVELQLAQRSVPMDGGRHGP